jgi:hypothetical protein
VEGKTNTSSLRLPLGEKIEKDIRMLFPGTHTTVFTHLEPVEDPASMLDISIDRK